MDVAVRRRSQEKCLDHGMFYAAQQFRCFCALVITFPSPTESDWFVVVLFILCKRKDVRQFSMGLMNDRNVSGAKEPESEDASCIWQ
jgi:hypothetical protein